MATPNEVAPNEVFKRIDGSDPATGVRTARGVPSLFLAWHDPWRGRAATVPSRGFLCRLLLGLPPKDEISGPLRPSGSSDEGTWFFL